jgi:ubiquinone/menaquinone biosynthesis C-methylase UbiE
MSFHSYASVAPEYYDAQRHPTCRNFRDASRHFLRDALCCLRWSGLALEVGAGDSLLGELAPNTFDKLILLDKSEDMLCYSRRFNDVANLVVGDALSLPFASNTFSLIVASLGDPFNVPKFWSEVRRTLKAEAYCIFTTPSYDWASSFRERSPAEQNGAALFELSNGEHLYLPSSVEPEPSQLEMMKDAGLSLIKKNNFGSDSIPGPHSTKILGCSNVVTGYLLQRI